MSEKEERDVLKDLEKISEYVKNHTSMEMPRSYIFSETDMNQFFQWIVEIEKNYLLHEEKINGLQDLIDVQNDSIKLLKEELIPLRMLRIEITKRFLYGRRVRATTGLNFGIYRDLLKVWAGAITSIKKKKYSGKTLNGVVWDEASDFDYDALRELIKVLEKEE